MSAAGSPRSDEGHDSDATEEIRTTDHEPRQNQEDVLPSGDEEGTPRGVDARVQPTPTGTGTPDPSQGPAGEEANDTTPRIAGESPHSPESHDLEQPMMTSSQSALSSSSGASSQRTSLSQMGESDLALQGFSQQLGNSDDEGAEEGSPESEKDSAAQQEEEEESELVVLDPDHPLMTRFQSALKQYLTKQIQALDIELREMSTSMKRHKSEREELGVSLYGIQQELARLQMSLEKQHDKHARVATLRRQKEDELETIRNLYKKTHQTTNAEHKTVSSMQTEVENLALHLFYMQNVNQDVRSDIAVMKRAVQKAEAERTQAEVEKQKQDLFVDRLTREADRLREQIALYEAQVSAQSDDTKAARETVAEACMEIETIGLEKKQLFQQWTSSLIGMRRRDEAYAAIQEALSLAQQELRSLDTEIEGYKMSAMKEEDRNEQLTVMFNRAESDAAMSRKLVAQCLARQEALKVEFSTYMRTLQETEQALNRVNIERAGHWSSLAALRKQIEREAQVKGTLEIQIMEKLQEKMTSDKAAKYSFLLTEKLRKKKLYVEIDYSKLENETAQVLLEISHGSSRIQALQRTVAELDKDIQGTNALISCSQVEITKRTVVIERKQASINLFSKQIEAAIAQMGGKELGPLEIHVTALTKQIDECNGEIRSLQQYWLRLQNDLVKLARQREEQDTSVEMLKKELTILLQKKVRTENEIEQEKIEQKDIEHHMKNLTNDMLRLNVLLSRNSNAKEQLQQHNLLIESDFMHSLRDAEREAIEMQERLGNLQGEKERLVYSLVEAEHHIMLWEKKIQLAKEMRNAVDSESGMGEVRAMKSEIHRMQVRHTQLMKQQEKMIRDMEAVVSRRETIMMRGQGQKDKKHLTSSDFRGKLQELRKKIKETQKNAEECNGTIGDLQETQQSLTAAIAEKQHGISTLKLHSISLEAEIEQLQETKRQNLSHIVSHQTRQKHLQAVKDGKYTPMCRTQQALEAEQQKQETHMHTVSTIIYQIQQEYPQYQTSLRSVSLALEARLGSQGETSERAP